MKRVPWLTAILLTLTLVSAPATSLLATPTMPEQAPTPTEPNALEHDTPWPETFQEALRWSTVNQDELIAPLLPGTATLGYAPETLEAYVDGEAWAHDRLSQIEPGDREILEHAVLDVLTLLDAPTQPLNLDAIPDAYVPAMTVLLEAQTNPIHGDDIVPPLSIDPIGFNRAITLNGAWTTGVIQALTPTLETLAHQELVGEDPVFVDPLGLIILGGNGDNTYTPVTGNPENDSPTLILEPGGNDTYHIEVASAGRQYVEHPPDRTLTIRKILPVLPITIEERGEDVYTTRAAVMHGILDERAGNDTYGQRNIENAVSAAWTGGYVFLNERGGDDTYYTKERGIAYASSATAVHADRAGDDFYRAAINNADGFTHAAGANVGALAVLRDYTGDDRYVSNGLSYASSEDDASTVFIDDEGRDEYYADYVGKGAFGWKYLEERGVWAPTQRTPAYFLDGNGTDAYDWGTLGPDGSPDDFGNQTTRFDARPDTRWSIFVDCETPPGADYPCPEENEHVVNRILETA